MQDVQKLVHHFLLEFFWIHQSLERMYILYRHIFVLILAICSFFSQLLVASLISDPQLFLTFRQLLVLVFQYLSHRSQLGFLMKQITFLASNEQILLFYRNLTLLRGLVLKIRPKDLNLASDIQLQGICSDLFAIEFQQFCLTLQRFI